VRLVVTGWKRGSWESISITSAALMGPLLGVLLDSWLLKQEDAMARWRCMLVVVVKFAGSGTA